MVEKKYNYVYITTNLINGKQYVGDHSTNDLKDDYLGSGNLFTQKIKQYGKENFKKEILEFFDTKQEAFDGQEKYIKIYESHISQNGYNISSRGGYGVPSSFLDESTKNKISESHKEIWKDSKIRKKLTKVRKGRIVSEETARKISKANKGRVLSEEWKDNISNGNKGRSSPNKGKKLSEEHKQKISAGVKKKFKDNPPNIGKKHSEESKRKMSESRKGSKRNEETKKKMREAWEKRKLTHDISGEKNPFYGKKHSEETKEKMRKTKKYK